MLEVSRLLGLCSSHLTISVPSRVLEGMGVLLLPFPEMEVCTCMHACVHMCLCVRVCMHLCAHVFVGDVISKLNIPCSLGYQALCELLRPLRTPLVKLTWSLDTYRVSREKAWDRWQVSETPWKSLIAFWDGTDRFPPSLQEILPWLLSPCLDFEFRESRHGTSLRLQPP